jgi:hypothetical protein
MAITINSVPADFASLHDDAWFVVSSDNATSDNFKYVFDAYVSGQLVSRVKATPAASAEGSYGVYNSAPIVRNYMTNYFKPVEGSVLQHSSDEIRIQYDIRFGEEVSGVLTTNLASGTYKGYNYYSPLFFDGILLLGGGDGDLLLSDQYNNLLISNYVDDWLTERKIDDIELIFGKRLFISFLAKEVTGGKIEVQKIDSNGDLGTAATGGDITFTGEFNLFEFGQNSINEYLGSEFIVDTDYGYKVRLNYDGIASNWIVIRHVCYDRTNPVNIHFLNRLGGWDTFGFNLVNNRNTEFNRRAFKRMQYQLSGDEMTNSDAFNRYNEGTINFSIEHRDGYRLISDYVREQDHNWLAQLVASPIVYLEVQGAYFPVIVTDNNYEYKMEKSDQLFNLEMGIEINKYVNSQYR